MALIPVPLEKITRKLQDEIIPEMLKLSPKLSKKINLNELTPEDLTGNEMNPEWESFFSDSTLGKKMVEFGELQQEGADVMHSTFVHLKNFPFFHELSNWLLPFTIEHSYFDDQFTPDNEAEKQMLDSMTFSAPGSGCPPLRICRRRSSAIRINIRFISA